MEELKISPTISLADPFFHVPNKVDVLLGGEFFWDLMEPGRFKTDEDQILLQETKLGWIVTGRTSSHNSVNTILCNLSIHEEINNQLKRFWQMEECKDEKVFTGEDKICEVHYTQNVTRLSSGAYMVKLPLKDNPESLGNSEREAKRRFLQLERRLLKQPELQRQYSAFMREYLELGHMEPVPEEELAEMSSTYYLPHHPVIKEGSSTTRLRVVFDASAKTESDRSLNDILMIGPTVQDDLFSIIARFRTHRYAVTADIEKMYRQIKIHPTNTNLQLILWRNKSTDPLKTFKLTTVAYGTASAPFLATNTLNQLANDECTEFTVASAVLKRDFYVDDLLTGSDTIEDTKRLRSELTELLKRGGFCLRKWNSNSKSILSEILEEERTSNSNLVFDQDTIKTLGLIWDPKTDVFRYAVKDMTQGEVHYTKRKLLSEIGRLFDPLGLLAPIIINCKMLLQQLWLKNVDWDEALHPDINQKWLLLRRSLQNIERLSIPRRITPETPFINAQLHGFCDASTVAYGACVYLRCIDEFSNTSVKLISSKSRVAPIKTQSIPRLELCGAVLLVELMTKIKSALHMSINEIFYWTDSTIVLAWLSAPSTNWNTFVANRVAKVQEDTDVGQWRHVRTNDNPADLISRGTTVTQLIESNIWWKGPTWLDGEKDSWPKIQVVEPEEEVLIETRKSKITLVAFGYEGDILTRYSEVNKLQRVVAFCLRFIRNARQSAPERQTGPLTSVELKSALVSVLKIGQWAMFQDEIIALNKGQSIPRKSKLCTLNPFIATDGLLRVGGRLHESNIPEEQKHQILLHPRNHLTELIAKDVHIRHLHAGPSALLHAIREQYWPLSGRQFARTIVHHCVRCAKLKFIPRNQLMGNLPENRVTPSRPFLHTGVDYCGPLFMRLGRCRTNRTTKVYIAIFICLSTKGIHIEVVSDLTTAAFLGALRRFTARRGRPAHMYSDNATNFVRANKDIQELFNQERNNELLQTTLSEEGIQWHYIPPRAPHVGGLWEAGVKAFKYHFRRVVGSTVLTLEELTTLTTQIEACLNSRPLSQNPSDPNEPSALTPSHLMTGYSITSLPDPDLTLIPEPRLNRWQHLQQMLQHFWQRWLKEYLNDLQQRSKWRSQHPNIQESAIVLLREDNLSPLSWKLGRVVTLHPGKDNLVRVVTVRTANGLVKRHINKLSVLPV